MTKLYWLDRTQPHHRFLVGNKAFHLSQLLQQGYPVISGFTVSAQVFQEFLETIDWLEPRFADLASSSLHLDIHNALQLQAVSRHIRQTIAGCSLADSLVPELQQAITKLQSPVLILRPSLVLEPSGSEQYHWNAIADSNSSALFRTQICRTVVSEVAQGLKQIWSEFFGAKSLFYWQRMRIPLQQIRLAVLVQPLHNAIASGTLRTEQQWFEVQAAFGLGMAITQGEAIPDFYQIHADTGVVQIQRLGSKTIAYAPAAFTALPLQVDVLQAHQLSLMQQQSYSLEPSLLHRLTQLARQLKADLGTAFEIEWVLNSVAESQPELALTQVNPRLMPSEARLLGLPHRQTQAVVNKPLAAQPAASVPLGSTLILKGLAAAPGRTIAKANVIARLSDLPETLAPDTILVAPTLPLHRIPLLQQAAGIVIEQGGMTCHAAIVARELGLPAVVAATNATQHIQPNDLILLDGDQGSIYRLPLTFKREPLTANVQSQIQSALSETPTIATQLMVNLSQPQGLSRLAELPIDGIGLLRSELLISSILNTQHPDVWIQQGRQAELVERLAEQVCRFAKAVMPRPVFYRSLDLRSHEFWSLTELESPVVNNSMLGVRGTLSYVMNPTLFDLELAALTQVQQSGYRNVNLMLPFVRTVDEFTFCCQRVEQANLRQNSQLQLWIMAEVPSVLYLLPEFVKAGVQGISIGTNDLTQLILGIDRDQGELATAFDEQHPAVMAAIAQLIQQAHRVGIPCSICGEAPVRHPKIIETLIRWGITSISVQLEAVEQTYQAIARAERKLLLEAIREGADSAIQREKFL